ncbi:MAG: cupredoxin domain-containing protein [Candidatus Thermoplasmatota archaeon]|jgi:plastocyanin
MRPAVVLVFALLALAIAGCNSSPDAPPTSTSSNASSTTGGQTSTSPTSTSTSSSAAPDYTVDLVDNRYDPTTLAVPNFQKVVFTNKGTLSHTVTIVRQGDPPGSFLRDQAIQPNTETDFNFPNDGTYNVYCRYHGTETSGMHMTITV